MHLAGEHTDVQYLKINGMFKRKLTSGNAAKGINAVVEGTVMKSYVCVLVENYSNGLESL